MPPPPAPPSRRQRTTSPPPPVAERIRGALLGLWLGDVLGFAMQGRNFPNVPEFPALFSKPPESAPARPPSRAHSLSLGFASCAAHCFLNGRQFHLGNLLNAYRRHAAFLQNAGKLAASSPPEETPPGKEPSIEPALAWTLEHFPRFHSPHAFLECHVRNPAPSPILDGVLLRALPAACFFYAQPSERMQAVTEEALATQTGPLGALASVAWAAAVSQCILSPDTYASNAKLLEVMQRDVADVAPTLIPMGINPASIQQALSLLKEDMECAQKTTPNLYGPTLNLRQHGGQLRLSFRLALWELLHAPEAEAASAAARLVEDVIRRGGSPASQGALVASLCGARWGKACLPNPGLEPFAPLPPQAWQPSSPGDASFLKTLAETMASKLS